jgi:hypothetical protein
VKGGLLFVNKKKQKNFMTALRALGLETPPSPPVRGCKANEVFWFFFSLLGARENSKICRQRRDLAVA